MASAAAAAVTKLVMDVAKTIPQFDGQAQCGFNERSDSWRL